MENIKKTCKTCGKEFWVIKQEQEFLAKMNLHHPSSCPGCREARRLADRGERQLYRTKCQNCQKDVIVSYNPETEKRRILCKDCYLQWFEKNQVLKTE
ncbi:MAG: hypothetical protein US40_C0003G0035 [Candidatus Roizmanbacteria bacterium GW2011_GWC2_37_13]|uniref:Probable zinc-binding domain-containing protein n=1 Tax=Candidatus Roizmanbacteria bacterium GW2011_GWC2_37_13 TaxID=1618486 RepID=A0A0G0G508_9BACT|nr:MAG: hypothetical protein US38_C0004G0037 [Candidatus Roizmanbacteria bacterium GW2011_GWC1_37_12]KKQ26183.1 MAG: hypothetical protein US40_C0003G0035 [Candidatus Roizmanbacteria bacterium GW2011_GWC2_37_13]